MGGQFAGKRVLVTGGARGIGKATVAHFRAAGAQVAVNGLRAASVDRAIADLGDTNLVAVPGDVGTVAGCRAVVAGAIAALGGLDILVNNAGVYYEARLEDVDEALWDHTLNVNLKGTFFCTQAALPALRATQGCIVNVASVSGLNGYAQETVFGAAKAGVVNLTRALAAELAPTIRVNCVCPDVVDTDAARAFVEAAPDPQAYLADLAAGVPLGRIAQPAEIAGAIAHLAAPDAAYLTGVILPVDGGKSLG